MEVIPKLESLPVIGKADMVIPTPFPDLATLTMEIGHPLFAKLVPFAIHQAASIYSEKKDSLVKKELARLTEATAISQRYS